MLALTYSTDCEFDMTVHLDATGPGSDDSYVDVRSDYTKNEVAVDYNAGLTGVLAALSGSQNSWASCVSGNYLIARGNLG